MKKTLIFALALTSVTLAGCADDTAETVPVVATPVVVEEAPMMDGAMGTDTTMMDGSMEAAPMEGEAMEVAPVEGETMDAAPMEGESM